MLCKICGVEETDNPDGICDDCKFNILNNKDIPPNFWFNKGKKRGCANLYRGRQKSYKLAQRSIERIVEKRKYRIFLFSLLIGYTIRIAPVNVNIRFIGCSPTNFLFVVFIFCPPLFFCKPLYIIVILYWFFTN